METATETPLMCSKCAKKPRADQNNRNPWCSDCRAEYQRGYVANLKKQTAEQSFARGVSQTKRIFANEFNRLGGGSFTGIEIASLIMQAPGPKFEDGDEGR